MESRSGDEREKGEGRGRGGEEQSFMTRRISYVEPCLLSKLGAGDSVGDFRLTTCFGTPSAPATVELDR